MFQSILMNHTPKEIENMPCQTMDASGAERLIIGCQTFDAFRAIIIASLPKDLPEEEFKKQLFERIYGAPMEDFLSGRVTDADLAR
jgi:hypothetical protein